jgi:hypothetical protein
MESTVLFSKRSVDRVERAESVHETVVGHLLELKIPTPRRTNRPSERVKRFTNVALKPSTSFANSLLLTPAGGTECCFQAIRNCHVLLRPMMHKVCMDLWLLNGAGGVALSHLHDSDLTKVFQLKKCQCVELPHQEGRHVAYYSRPLHSCLLKWRQRATISSS